MKKILLFMTMMTSITSFAQSNFETATDEQNGSVVFKGNISFNDLQTEKTFEWFQKSKAYIPDAASITFLKDNLSRYRMVVFMGTWCEDSHYLIPRLHKVLSEAGYPMAEFTMYGVDRTKTTKDGAHEQYKVSKVPTIILIQNGIEKGRITETAQKSVEADLVNIIKGQ
jgi:thiol-disulfide isomerase/thioredoxin